tara:strand:+ start:2578 stop:3816 length:1239 start_codon:yes stop_codon:yes gene_type:complete
MTSLAYDKEKLRKVVINALSKNEIIFDNWAIGEIASGIEKLDISKYETHLSKVFDLTLKALEQTTSVKTVQKGGGFPIKVIILSIIFGMLYGFLNHQVTTQIDEGLNEIQEEILKVSDELNEFKAYHTSLVLKNLPENVMIGGCNYYDTNTAKFIENKPENLEIKLIGQAKDAEENMKNAEMAIVKYKPQSFSNSKGKDLTKFTEVFQCQSNNIARAIQKDAELFAWKMFGDVTQDTKKKSLFDNVLTGFGLLANPTDTATVTIDNIDHSIKQGQRRLNIKTKQIEILNQRYQILVGNINNIVKNRGLNIRNLVIAKQFAGAISLAGVRYLAPGVPIGEFTASGITQKLASGITYEGLNLLEDINDSDDKKGGKKRKTKRNRKKKNKKKTKKAKKSKKKKNKKTKKARKKRR